MSDLQNNISKMEIRGQANLIFTMMKFMITVLDMVKENPIARDTLVCMAEGVLEQASILHRDVGKYVSALPDTDEKASAS